MLFRSRIEVVVQADQADHEHGDAETDPHRAFAEDGEVQAAVGPGLFLEEGAREDQHREAEAFVLGPLEPQDDHQAQDNGE